MKAKLGALMALMIPIVLAGALSTPVPGALPTSMLLGQTGDSVHCANCEDMDDPPASCEIPDEGQTDEWCYEWFEPGLGYQICNTWGDQCIVGVDRLALGGSYLSGATTAWQQVASGAELMRGCGARVVERRYSAPTVQSLMARTSVIAL